MASALWLVCKPVACIEVSQTRKFLLVAEVFRANFWMQLLGSPTPKRSSVFSNGGWIFGLDLGKLTKQIREQSTRFKSTRWILSYAVHVGFMRA